MVVLDFYLVAEYSDFFDDDLNELVFLDGIHVVPDGADVGEEFTNLILGKAAPIRVQPLCLREPPVNNH